MNPCLAIIDHNTLSNIALKNIITNTFGPVEVYSYKDMDSFIRDSNRHFIHFFVSSDIFFRHLDEFEMLRGQTTVLSDGPNKRYTAAGYSVLDISMPVEEIVGKLLMIQLVRKYGEDTLQRLDKEKLTPRENEVLKLMVKGLINKEIAKELNISITTAIFHRNNICEKLQTRSLGRLTIFAVLTGVVDINEI